MAAPRIGGEHGYPVTSDPTAIFYNPAALSLGEKNQFQLNVDVVFRTASYRHSFEGNGSDKDLPEPIGAEGANVGTATLFNTFAGANLFYAGHFDDLSLAFAFYVPYGGAVEFDKNTAFSGNRQFPGAVDGVQRWHAISGTFIVGTFSMGGAYRFDRFSLGLAGNIMYTTVGFTQAATATGSNDIDLEGRSRTEAEGWDWSFTIGATVELLPARLWLGLSYLSQPNLGAGSNLHGTLENTFALAPERIDVHQRLPDVVRAGFRYQPDATLQIRISADYTHWSVFEAQCLSRAGEPCGLEPSGRARVGTLRYFNRSLRNTWGARAGVSYWPNEAIEILTGFGYDGNAVPAGTMDAALMDANDLSATVGLGLELSDAYSLGVEYTHFLFFDRDTRGQSILATAPSGSRNPDAAGEYAQSLDLITVVAEARL